MAIQQGLQEGRGRERTLGRSQTARSRSGTGQNGGGEALSTGLGWFSVGLGLAELTSPGGVARMIGVRDDDENRAAVLACGLRELASGFGILARPDNPGFLWARVGGDMMDLSLLGGALKQEDSKPERLAMAAAAVLGVTALDVLAGQKLSGGAGASGRAMQALRGQQGLERGGARALPSSKHAVQVRHAITVNRPREEVYAFWHDFQNLPRFMRHLESVQLTGARRSHWKAKAPAGMSIEWDAEVTEDQINERIAWRSLAGSQVENAGNVRFVAAPGGRGTEVHVELMYRPPAGSIGRIVAKLFGEAPEQQIRDDMRIFKQVIETGDVVTSDASFHRRPHAARPPETLARR